MENKNYRCKTITRCPMSLSTLCYATENGRPIAYGRGWYYGYLGRYTDVYGQKQPLNDCGFSYRFDFLSDSLEVSPSCSHKVELSDIFRQRLLLRIIYVAERLPESQQRMLKDGKEVMANVDSWWNKSYMGSSDNSNRRSPFTVHRM